MMTRRILEVLAIVLVVAIGTCGTIYIYRAKVEHNRAELAWLAATERVTHFVGVRVMHQQGATWDGFAKVLLKEASDAEIDYRLVMAIIEKESEWNPAAVSARCAVGLMQLMPATAKEVARFHKLAYTPPTPAPVGKDGKRGKCYTALGSLGDPVFNITIGIRYLHEQVIQYGMGPLPLRSYNRGPAKAAVVWRGDRYAEDVALAYLALAHTQPAPPRRF